jgi:hypothetical protein
VRATDGSGRRGVVVSDRFVPATRFVLVRGAAGEEWEVPEHNVREEP